MCAWTKGYRKRLLDKLIYKRSWAIIADTSYLGITWEWEWELEKASLLGSNDDIM